MTEIKKRRGRPKKNEVIEKEYPLEDGLIQEPVKEDAKESAKILAKELVKSFENVDIQDMPLETFDDYREYNKVARKKKIPVKFPPISMFPTARTKIIRADGQGKNPIHVRIRDAKLLLDYDEELPCSENIEIPQAVISWINNRAKSVYKEVKYPDGTSATQFSHHEPRFSCQMVM